MSFTAAALTLAWVCIVLLALAVAGLARRLQESRDSAAAGTTGLDAGALRGFALPASGPLAALRCPERSVVLFSSPSCPSCHDILTALADAGLGARLSVVSLGDCGAVSELVPHARCRPQGGALFDALGIPGAPYLLAVDADGTILDTLLPEGPEDLQRWLAPALATRLPLTPAGTPAPRPAAPVSAHAPTAQEQR